MAVRNWIINEKEMNDPDTVLFYNLAKMDTIINWGSVRQVKNANLYGSDVIPIGDIDFVGSWLQKNYNKKMHPIEVPEILRSKEFLRRSYRFVKRDNLPYRESGRFFVKNASRLKEFHSALYEGRIPNPDTMEDGVYVISGWLDIIAEYRVFVFHDKIMAVQPYQGAPMAFPDPQRIEGMVSAYQGDKTRPEAYTMDVAVIPADNNSSKTETVILEIHPFVSCGLYGFNDPDLLDMWEAGIRYYISCKNDEIKVDS